MRLTVNVDSRVFRLLLEVMRLFHNRSRGKSQEFDIEGTRESVIRNFRQRCVISEEVLVQEWRAALVVRIMR